MNRGAPVMAIGCQVSGSACETRHESATLALNQLGPKGPHHLSTDTSPKPTPSVRRKAVGSYLRWFDSNIGLKGCGGLIPAGLFGLLVACGAYPASLVTVDLTPLVHGVESCSSVLVLPG